MTDLMRMLYDYIETSEMDKYLQSEEYCRVHEAVNQRQDELLKQFPELFDPLDDLLCAINRDHAMEMKAMFQATLALEVKLAR